MSSTLWPWDSHHASSIRNVKGQAADTHDGNESSGEINIDDGSPDSSMHEYYPFLPCIHRHTPRSQSLHWDRRETSLMCINHKCGYYVQHASDDVKHDLPTRDTGNKTENEGVEIDKEKGNVPLLFKVDSKGRQDILDLLDVEKQSSDNNAIDVLNQIVDIITHEQKENKNKLIPDGQDAINSTSDDTRSSTPWQYHHLKQSSNKPHFEQRANIKPDWPIHRNTIGAYTRHNSVGRDHVALCSGGQDKTPPVEDADAGDKPSKEQLAVMYHRLYEQVIMYCIHINLIWC